MQVSVSSNRPAQLSFFYHARPRSCLGCLNGSYAPENYKLLEGRAKGAEAPTPILEGAKPLHF